MRFWFGWNREPVEGVREDKIRSISSQCRAKWVKSRNLTRGVFCLFVVVC